MIANEAKWHHTCMLRYNNTKLKRAEKRVMPSTLSDDVPYKRSRLRSSCVNKESCFFCGQAADTDSLHEASTFQIDHRVRECAELVQDTLLLGKLSMGDMVALEAKYHTKCLVALYNRARKVKADTQQGGTDIDVHGFVFAELVMYIEEACLEATTAPVFKLADLAHLYMSRMEQFGVVNDKRVNTTRLKERLLAQFPDLRAYSKGRDMMLAFGEDIGSALDKACIHDSDGDAVHLARAAQIVRRHLFENSRTFNGSFEENCQKSSVPNSLLVLVNMVLEGPSIKDQMCEGSTPASLTIAQILKYNSVKHMRTHADTVSVSSVRHSTSQETPAPIYIGLMLHAKTRKKELVDKLFSLGLSISYDRVLRLSAEMGNNVCQRFHMEQVVCPPSLRGGVFTTAAADNIDHNPTSTTAKDSFHGTGISLLQHPTCANEGVHRGVVTIGGNAGSKKVSHLPHFYTDVPPVTSNVKQTAVPSTSVTSLKRVSFKKHREEEYKWLENTRHVLEDNSQSSSENISWAAYHAKNGDQVITPTALLPLFQECAHSVAMIRHSMDVVKSAVENLNPGQTPVVTFDQPLYALAKQIQWKWPEKYGEDKFVVMFGGLHIEMAALKAIGNWLQGSGWAQALVQAEIATAGTADSFYQATHVMRTRRAHQITAAALYILQHRAYDKCSHSDVGDGPLDFETWCDVKRNCPQFQFWDTTMDLEVCVLTYVRSLRQADFGMYLDALTELVPWFYTLNHTNYARWIPVHLRDMAELPNKHPEVYREFTAGHFTVQKTKRVFSAIPIDQAHEQNNACVKGDGGAVGLTDNPSALRRWMIAGPEVARVISEFENDLHRNASMLTCHHDQTASVQISFARDVRSLVAAIDEFGNPFEEESQDLLVLDTKEIADPAAVNTVRDAKKIGQKQFDAFAKECLIDRSKSINDAIHRNKLPLFGTPRTTSKGKQQLTSLKSDVELFSRLYISCQTRDGNLEEFFRHENQACPPSLSDGGKLHLGAKSDLLACLEDLSEPQSEAPSVTSVVLDGAVIVQMLKPGAAKTFRDYADMVFLPYISGQLRHVTRLDLVWDSYVVDSLKATARAKRGKGVRRRVVESAPIPGNWQNFLRVDLNKKELFCFLSKSVVESIVEDSKELVVTDGEQVLCVPPQQDVQSLAPCSHEEADSRMMLHVAHAAKHDHHRILVRTVDTDVVVLAVMVAQTLSCETELWIAFGTGKNFRYLAAHRIASCLGPEKSLALPMFHALTGCDTVSAFVGHGKKTAWAVWNSLPELTDALLRLGQTPTEIPVQSMQSIERFVILLYDRTNNCTDVNKARKKLFTKKCSVQRIPPSLAALEQHVKRATFQGGHIWGQVLVPQPLLPSPNSWGWIKNDGLYEPLWTTLPEASKTCYELISCGCQKGCRNRCKCKKAALKCTALCKCEGECRTD